MNNGILFDTCTLIKYLNGDLPESAKSHIAACPRDQRYVSVATAWEVILKPQLRHIGVDALRLERAIEQLKLRVLEVRLADIWFLNGLPEMEDHRDPFDRMIIAHAYVYGLTIITSDRQFSRYPQLKVVW